MGKPRSSTWLCAVGLVGAIAVLGACSDDSSGSGATTTTAVAGGVGQPGGGQVAWKFVGHLDQEADDFNGYGYLTHVDGLDDGDLFTGSSHDESTAVFTVVIDATATDKNKLDNLTVVDTTGTATVYYNADGGASFDDPTSFTKGTAVATLDVSGQNVLSINPDNRDEGIAAATAELRQSDAAAFDFGGDHHQFGRPDLVLRMAVNGPGTRTDPAVPASTIEVAGDVIVAGA